MNSLMNEKKLCFYVLLFVAVLGWGTACTPSNSTQTDDEQRIGFDPLSLKERETAQQVALQAPEVNDLLDQAARYAVILVERHEETKEITAQGNWDRRADVFIYDYSDDSLIQVIVNLSSNSVASLEEVQSVQLPFSQSEIQKVFEILLADSNIRAQIQKAYETATEESLPDSMEAIEEAIALYVHVYNAQILPNSPDEAALCGIQRCGEIVLLVKETGYALPVQAIVSLSTSEVVYTFTD